MLWKTGVALRARCCWLRVFGVSARCGMRKPNTRASVKPRPVQLAKLELLFLDELGYVPASKVGAELLFDVISTAYERTSMIVTTNLPFESWTEVLGSERLTGATLDRLTHRCRIIETKGESYRLHDAKKRNQPRPNPDAVTLPTSTNDEIFTATTPN